MNAGNKTLLIESGCADMSPPLQHPLHKKICAIDIGSKNVKLVMGECNDGRLHTRMVAKEALYLGRNIEQNHGRVGSGKLDELRNTLGRFLAMGSKLGAGETLAIATNAVRNASNKQAVLETALDLGLNLVIADGQREGEVGYLAATRGVGNRIVSELGSGSGQIAWRTDGEIESKAIDNMGYERTYEKIFGPAHNFNEARNRYRNYLAEQFNNLPDYRAMQYIALASKSMAAFVVGLDKEDVIGLELSKSALQRKISRIGKMNASQFMLLESTLKKVEKILPGMIFVDYVMEISRSQTVLIEEAELPTGLMVEYFGGSANQPARRSTKHPSRRTGAPSHSNPPITGH